MPRESSHRSEEWACEWERHVAWLQNWVNVWYSTPGIFVYMIARHRQCCFGIILFHYGQTLKIINTQSHRLLKCRCFYIMKHFDWNDWLMWCTFCDILLTGQNNSFIKLSNSYFFTHALEGTRLLRTRLSQTPRQVLKSTHFSSFPANNGQKHVLKVVVLCVVLLSRGV